MSLFRPGLSVTERRDLNNLRDIIDNAPGGRRKVHAGVTVNDMSAMQLGAVWGCVDLISELVSTLPVDEYRTLGGVDVEQSLPPLLVDPAGDGYGFEVWARQALTSWLLRGNLYGWIEALGGDGWPSQVASVHPDEITARRERRNGPVEWFRDNKRVDRWPAGPLWHVPAYVLPGSPLGMSPIAAAAQTIGVGLAAQKYGAEWFGQGKIPPAVVESDQPVDKTNADIVKGRVNDALNEGGPLVLGIGLKFKPIMVAPEEAQFLETIKANADDIARFFFRRPPGEGGQVTYANVEARSLDLLTYTLTGWLVRFEKALTRLRPRPRFVKFNADALVRVDTAARYNAHASAIRSGWKSRDDVRELENLAPIPDGTGGEYLWPPYSTTDGGATSDRSAEPARPGT